MKTKRPHKYTEWESATNKQRRGEDINPFNQRDGAEPQGNTCQEKKSPGVGGVSYPRAK